MRHTEIYEAKVADAYLPYLVNGDGSGISKNERKMVDRWLAEMDKLIRRNHSISSYHIDHDSKDAGFARCEICKMQAKVYDIRFVVLL